MKAIFIAAGEGSRLENLTKDLPKPLVEINGKSIIERQIELLRKNNVNDIIVVTGYKKEKFTFKNIKYIHNPNFREQEQTGSLMVARSEIVGDILIMFGDILFEETILQQMLNSKCDIVIAIDKNWEKSYEERPDNPKSEADKVLIKDDKVIQISAKNIKINDNDNNIGELLGLMKLSPKGSKILIEQYKKLENSHVGKFHDAPSFKKAKFVDILQELLSLGIIITPVSIIGKWCEIDTKHDLEIAKKMFK
jgi:phosphoenolpyruvate phosphomutase|tara:strand:- start:90 stop:842 length:753 start_codon:yes stop_codon:yes gene_type:complete